MESATHRCHGPPVQACAANQAPAPVRPTSMIFMLPSAPIRMFSSLMSLRARTREHMDGVARAHTREHVHGVTRACTRLSRTHHTLLERQSSRGLPASCLAQTKSLQVDAGQPPSLLKPCVHPACTATATHTLLCTTVLLRWSACCGCLHTPVHHLSAVAVLQPRHDLLQDDGGLAL